MAIAMAAVSAATGPPVVVVAERAANSVRRYAAPTTSRAAGPRAAGVPNRHAARRASRSMGGSSRTSGPRRAAYRVLASMEVGSPMEEGDDPSSSDADGLTVAGEVDEGPVPRLFKGDPYFYACTMVFTINFILMGVKGADASFFLFLLGFLGFSARKRAAPTTEWRELPQGLPWAPKKYGVYQDAGVVLGLILPTIVVVVSMFAAPTDIYYVLAPLTSIICMQTFVERVARRYEWAPVLRIASRVAVGLKAMSSLSFTIRTLWWWGPPSLFRQKLVIGEGLIALVMVLSLLNFAYWAFYLTWDLVLGVLPAMLRPEFGTPAAEGA